MLLKPFYKVNNCNNKKYQYQVTVKYPNIVKVVPFWIGRDCTILCFEVGNKA